VLTALKGLRDASLKFEFAGNKEIGRRHQTNRCHQVSWEKIANHNSVNGSATLNNLGVNETAKSCPYFMTF